jgi:hypothetical protein
LVSNTPFGLASGARGVHHQGIINLGDFIPTFVGRTALTLFFDEFCAVGMDDYHFNFPMYLSQGEIQPLDLIRRNENNTGVAMLDDISELRGLCQQIDRGHAKTTVHDADEQPAGLVAIGHQQGDLVPLRGTSIAQHAGEPTRVALQLAKAHGHSRFGSNQIRLGRTNIRLVIDVAAYRALHSYASFS